MSTEPPLFPPTELFVYSNREGVVCVRFSAAAISGTPSVQLTVEESLTLIRFMQGVSRRFP